MDTRLLESLHSKLADLDHKVRAYRREVVADFQRHCDQALRNIDPAERDDIYLAIASSSSDYPAIRSELELALPPVLAQKSLDETTSAGLATFQSPPPSSAFGDDSAAVELHEREREFQGLFTPSFLPLLESYPSLPRSPPVTTPIAPIAAVRATACPSTPPGRPASPGFGHGASLGTAAAMEGPKDITESQPVSDRSLSPTSPRPEHVRQATDDTASSAFSDKSESKAPRSALRRNSGALKTPQSPRRVRFEYMGAEVLPTASPQATNMVAPRPSSPAVPRDPDLPRSMLDVPDEMEAAPRKISSSDALRAMSRTPLDAGTVWTVVNPDSEDSSTSTRSATPTRSAATEPSATQPPSSSRPQAGESESSPSAFTRNTGRAPRRRDEDDDDDDDDGDDDSDDGFLSMGKSKSFATKKSIKPVAKAAGPDVSEKPISGGPTEASKPNSVPTPKNQVQASLSEVLPDDGSSEDDMFQFETGLSAPPRPKSKPSVPENPPEKDMEEDLGAGSEALGNTAPPFSASSFGSAPAMTIPTRSQAVPGGPSTPTAVRAQPGSVGSYKGRPLMMPVVRNPEVHAQAASLGQVGTFVGGLDGRSGVDDGDLNSFRASIGGFAGQQFSGTPRSLTERLMMEDAMEKRGFSEQ